jgi:hypothetical protein
MNKGIAGFPGLLKDGDTNRGRLAISNTGATDVATTFYSELLEPSTQPAPQLTVTETGYYLIEIGCSYARNGSGAGATAGMNISINGRMAGKDAWESPTPQNILLAAMGVEPKYFYNGLDYDNSCFVDAGSASCGSSISTQKAMYLQAGDVVRAEYRSSSGTSRFGRNRFLKLTRLN